LDQAIILAGGKGERLRPHTDDKPKAMISVLGNPLLSFPLRLLSSYGFKKITICTGYRHEILSEYFGDGSKFDVRLDYLLEEEPLGRGGALRRALEHIKPTGPVLAMNGDLLTNINIAELVKFHQLHRAIATLVAVPLRSPYGVIDIIDETVISRFKEKPELPFWINAGIYILDPNIIEKLPHKGDHEESTFPQLAKERQLRVYKTHAFWKAIDTVKDLNEVRNEIAEQLVFGTFLRPHPSVR
jgi:NDP-sugar pyrophosphorylase family protein